MFLRTLNKPWLPWHQKNSPCYSYASQFSAVFISSKDVTRGNTLRRINQLLFWLQLPLSDVALILTKSSLMISERCLSNVTSGAQWISCSYWILQYYSTSSPTLFIIFWLLTSMLYWFCHVEQDFWTYLQCMTYIGQKNAQLNEMAKGLKLATVNDAPVKLECVNVNASNKWEHQKPCLCGTLRQKRF